MSRGNTPYAAEYRQQMVELVRAGRKPQTAPLAVGWTPSGLGASQPLPSQILYRISGHRRLTEDTPYRFHRL